jgi:drug/metabolite transporter (DMT)-like permease
MSPRLFDHAWIFLTVALASYSQLIMKWQVSGFGPLPRDLSLKTIAVFQLLLQPWILSALLATFLSGVCWMITLTKFDLSYAFPFTALSFLVMFFAGALLFGESISIGKFAGTLLVLGGVLCIVLSSPESSR